MREKCQNINTNILNTYQRMQKDGWLDMVQRNRRSQSCPCDAQFPFQSCRKSHLPMLGLAPLVINGTDAQINAPPSHALTFCVFVNSSKCGRLGFLNPVFLKESMKIFFLRGCIVFGVDLCRLSEALAAGFCDFCSLGDRLEN